MSAVSRTNMGGGGAATSSGTTFQEDVAAYLSTLILAESSAQPPANLPHVVTLTSIVAESPQPIDDLLVGTSAGGVLYIQAKTNLSRSDDPESEFAKVIDQLVRQRLLGARPIGGPVRPLDPTRDRFVLAVGPAAPATITESLAGVLEKCRPVVDAARLAGLPNTLNQQEREVLATTRSHIQRIWLALEGKPPTPEEELSLLHLMRVEQFDFRPQGSHFVRANDLLRQVILTEPVRSGDAWNALISICRTFGPKRTGGDLPFLRVELQSHGILIRSVPSFTADIASLRKYTADRLAFLRRLSVMELGGQSIKINREVVGALRGFSDNDHAAVIGEPGAGKSGCVHDLAEQLLANSKDVVLLAADMANASSPEALAADLGLTRNRSLVDVLQSWSGDGNGYLLIDALDAARSGISLHVLCQILRDVRSRAPRWHIVASIREYDLRSSPDVQDLFAGTPHPRFNEPRFSKVRHCRVDRLSPAELSQVSDVHASVRSAIDNAPALSQLIRNPFNLSLLCKLLDQNVPDAELTRVETQVGLLDLYWFRRVMTGDRPGRLLVLKAAVDQMVTRRELNVSRIALTQAVPANGTAIEELLGDGVLVELALRANAAPVVAFAHNILFDYAVCRLWLDGLSDEVIVRLSEPANHDLLLAIRPSIAMAFEELWFRDDTRAQFWERAMGFARAPQMRLIGKIIAASVAAQQFRQVQDARPLIDGIQRSDDSAVALLRFTIQAAIAQHDAAPRQHPMVGDAVPQWMGLAANLTRHLNSVAWEVRSLLWTLVRGEASCTAEQARSANEAALALLRFGLTNARFRNVVRPAIEVATGTVASSPEATTTALAEALTEENLAIGAHEWLHPLAERLHLLAQFTPAFALHVVDVVFAATGDREAAVPMGGRILSLTMNKHDLFKMGRHDVHREFPAIWKQDPVLATRIVIRVMNATMAEEHANLTEPNNVYRVAFRGGHATLRPDASHIWTAGEHNRHEDWYRILSAFKDGLKTLASNAQTHVHLQQVLAVLRDEAELAVIWNALLTAASEAPTTLAPAIAELLAAPEILSQIDTRTAAGEVIARAFGTFTPTQRSAIEVAILRIPEETSDEMKEYAIHRRDRMLGCIPVELIQSPEIRKIRDALDAADGPPPNVPDFSISTSWDGPEEHWWLRDQGVTPEKPANTQLLAISKSLKDIPRRKPSEPLLLETANSFLPLLRDADAAIKRGLTAGADAPLTEHVADQLVDACGHLATAEGLRPEMPLTVFVREILRRGSLSERPQPRDEDDEYWDRETAGWGSPSSRIDAALGLMYLASNRETVDAEILADIARLAADPVHAVRFQVLAHLSWLYRTAPDLMWNLIESTCQSEPKAGVLAHFCTNVLLWLPHNDVQQVEPHVRALFHRARHCLKGDVVRRSCTTFYLRAGLWDSDRRALRYLNVFANRPLSCPVEANTIVDHCRGLIRYRKDASPEENKRVRLWAFDFLTRVVRALLRDTAQLREKNNNKPLDQWSQPDIDALRTLHQLAHNVATEVYFGSGAYQDRNYDQRDDDTQAVSKTEKADFIAEGNELFDALCDIEFVESAYDVLQTLEFLVGADPLRVILRLSALVRRAERDGIQYESMAADLVVRIVERYLSEYGNLFRDNGLARGALLDILDVFVGAGWPGATRLTYRLGEVFR